MVAPTFTALRKLAVAVVAVIDTQLKVMAALLALFKRVTL